MIPYRNIMMTGVLLITWSYPSPLFSEGRNKITYNECNNFIVISGQSNVNHFSFTYSRQTGDRGDFLLYPVVDKGSELKIPVRDFEPSNPLMYNDFLNDLREREYPVITIKFPDIELSKYNEPSLSTKYEVQITIAGITREYSVECFLQYCSNHYLLKGSKMIRLSDFQISPPEKLSGLIKVKDEINVSFGIILNFTSANAIPTTQ